MSRLFYILFLSAYAFCALAPVPAHAQPKGRTAPNLQQPGQLELEQGRAVFEAFRERGIAGSHLLRFTFRHMPRRGETEAFTGILYSNWNRSVPALRVVVDDHRDASRRSLLMLSGPQPEIWGGTEPGKAGTDESDPRAVRLERLAPEALDDPILPGIAVRPMDLALPFLYWDDVRYEGTQRQRGRPVHTYSLVPPADDPRYADIGSIALILDADFLAILEVRVFDTDGRLARSLKVGGFRKVDEDWIFSWIDLIDERTRDKTRFEWTEALLHQNIADAIFRPEGGRASAAP